MVKHDNERIERIPAYIRRATQDLSKSPVYEGVFWNPPVKYNFKNKSPPKPSTVRIYEAHGKFCKSLKMVFISNYQ
jgi:1,4-alpha-glucan branching enzyme